VNILPFIDTEFDDPEAFEAFALANGMAHQRIYNVMYSIGKPFTYYPLMDAESDTDWLLILNQQMQSIYAKLGINGLPDFAGVDLHKREDFEDFMLSYGRSLQLVNIVLNIH